MTTSGKLEQTNGVSSDPVLASAKSNTLQSDDRLATSASSQKFNYQMDTPEEKVIQYLTQFKISEDKIISK